MHLPIVCSIDSFIAAAAMAVAGCPRTWRRALIAGFATFDMLAGLSGLSLSPSAATAIVLIALIAAAAILAPARKYPALFLLVPVLFSADNLALGVTDVHISLSSALIDGVSSGVMAAAGLAAVASLAKRSAQNIFQGAAR
jgi:hypothetical protein